jgi:hypothetical protein
VSGCNDDSKDDWFISPTYINFYVTDSAGVNKLNSTGTLYDEYMKTTVTYNGKTYKCNEAVTPTDGDITGLSTAKDKYDKYYFKFGAFNTRDNWQDQKLTITWPDGSTDTFTFTSLISWKNDSPRFEQKFYVNGTEITSSYQSKGSYTFIKK